MKTSKLVRALLATASAAIVAVALAACGSSDSDQSADAGRTAQEANRTLVVDFYNSFFNRHDVNAATVVADDYKQHNPQVPDGKAPFVSYFAEYFRANPQATNRIVRSATDSDLVYLHVHSASGPSDRGQAVVDIFRVADGKIVEHWDVIQDVPAESANGNSMF
ncbi:nuclear transport factor 2 family protein [Gordonia sp. PDNC005]|uniref:nuclear transport factor 2 family protein n=1 Tax=unclassified Gordonia (in: high G+C Gram-positive bacteria) TaxID=2657482 RepID=UPI001965F588|nr:nuclear transport factor 2 family protein [Gordonia sp. PDNC005]QRY63267.1 nuclear transport factor 2 family protein [Gordonia sp. PDNC005]